MQYSPDESYCYWYGRVIARVLGLKAVGLNRILDWRGVYPLQYREYLILLHNIILCAALWGSYHIVRLTYKEDGHLRFFKSNLIWLGHFDFTKTHTHVIYPNEYVWPKRFDFVAHIKEQWHFGKRYNSTCYVVYPTYLF